jgi:hypothetical protein
MEALEADRYMEVGLVRGLLGRATMVAEQALVFLAAVAEAPEARV